MPPTVKSEVRMRPPSLLGHKEATRRCSSPPKASLTPNKTWHTPVTTHNTADANTEGVLFQSPKGLWIHISSHVCRHWVSIQREKIPFNHKPSACWDDQSSHPPMVLGWGQCQESLACSAQRAGSGGLCEQ